MSSVFSLFGQDTIWRTNAPAGAWSSLNGFVGARGAINWQIFTPHPGLVSSQHCPMIIWLHGGAKSNGEPDTLTPSIFASTRSQTRFPCYLLVPCAIQGRNWVNESGRRVFKASDLRAEPTASMLLVMELLDRLLVEHPIDSERILLGGASGGGYGVWAFLAAFPDRFSGAFPIAAGGDPARIQALEGMRIWLFHGRRDGVVPLPEAMQMYEALLWQRGTAAGVGETPGVYMLGAPDGLSRMTIYRSAGHGDVAGRALAEPDFLEWFFNRR